MFKIDDFFIAQSWLFPVNRRSKQNGKFVHTHVESTLQTLRKLGQHASRTHHGPGSVGEMDLVLFGRYLNRDRNVDTGHH